MLRFVFVFVFISLVCHVLSIGKGKEFLIQNNDRILFLGDTNLIVGSIHTYGFVSIFKSECAMFLTNVSIFSSAEKYSTDLPHLQSSVIPYYRPNKIVLITGVSEFVKNEDNHESIIKNARFTLESLVSVFVNRNIQIILCSMDIDGELIVDNDATKLQILSEEYVWATRQVASDYGAMHIDIYSPMLKYLENTNIDNMPDSVLTFDGRLLNENGHAFVAQILIQRLLGQTTGFVTNNIAEQEQRRVSRLKETMHFREQNSIEVSAI